MAMSASLDDAPSAAIAEYLPVAQKIGKRKRSTEAENHDFAPAQRDNVDPDSKQTFDKFLADVSTVLKQRDPRPSVLQQPLTSKRDATPTVKKAKLSNQPEATFTVQSRIDTKEYSSINELSDDIAAAVQAASLEGDAPRTEKLESFEIYYKTLIARQSAQAPTSHSVEAKNVDSDTIEVTQIKTEVDTENTARTRLVLQSIGTGRKPFFSSIKQGSQNRVLQEDVSEEKESLEGMLPKSVSVAVVGPVVGYDSKSKDHRIPTLGQVCPLPSRLPAYRTPQDSTRAITRGSTVGWYRPPQFPVSSNRGEGRVSYSRQRLSVGSWLSSNNPPPPPNDTINDRRRQRDRVLSAGTQRLEQTAEELAEARSAEEQHRRKKDLALFRSVYSSFAPTFDNTKSVVPQELTSRIWWNKRQEVDNDAIDDFLQTKDDGVAQTADQDDEERDFADAVTSFEEDSSVPTNLKENADDERSIADKDTQDLLDEISAMLETLSSYQRRRHSELKALARPALAEIIGTPSSPASSEVEMHNMLRDQLAAVVEMLPPFAVARLNGDQLDELNIKTSMTVETVMHKGLLDDEIKRIAHPSAGGAARPQNIAPRATAGFQNNLAASGNRVSSSSSLRQAPAFHGGLATPTPTPNYTSYQPLQQSAAQRTNFQFVQNTSPARNSPQTNGIRPSSQSNYSSYGQGTPMQPQSVQHQRPSQPHFPPQSQQSSGYGSGFSPQPVRGGSPQSSGVSYGGQPARQPSQMTPAQQQYYAGKNSVSRAAMSNGVGTIGSQIQLSADERARLIARQPPQPQMLPQQESPSAPRALSKELTPIANGRSPSRATSSDPHAAITVVQASSPSAKQEQPSAALNGQSSS